MRPTDFSSFVDNWIRTAEQGVLPLLIGAGFICFLWGVALYMRSSGDEKARSDGVQFMTWGIVGLVAIFGVWGFVGLVAKLVGADVAVPQL
jgi:hypothetical protein